MRWRITDSDFRFIEENVRLYKLYRKQLNEAIQDIIHATPIHDDNGGGKSNLPSRPVEHTVENLFEDAKIAKLKKYVDAIEQAYNELNAEKQRFITLLYWTSPAKSADWICDEFGIHYNTYTRWRKAFLLRVGIITQDYMGDYFD